MGFLERWFGGGGAPKRSVQAGEICQKCGQPVPLDNLAFDTGGGRPIHRVCPAAAEAEPEG